MRIGWVGGLVRSREILIRAARDAGHTLEMHTGDTGGRGAEGLGRLIDRVDLVIIVIEVNSHGGALQAKELARRRGRPSIVIRRAGVSSLQRILKELPAALPAPETLPQATPRRFHGKMESFRGHPH